MIAPHAASVFADRARRFAHLADGHVSGDYLLLLSRLSNFQHDLLQRHPEVALPDAPARERARQYAMPPVPANGWQRDPVWRAHLHAIIDGMLPAAPDALRLVLGELATLDVAELERVADAALRCEYNLGDPAETARLPFVAAALQVYWTAMAANLGAAALNRLDVPGVCPCCGSLPVASVVQAGQYAGTRYLHCSLCNTEWNLVRVNCSACGETDRVSYRVLQSGDGQSAETVRAEVCDDCHGYLKLIHRDKDGAADPVADDLATLALDILVDEAGYLRSGPNPFFIPGDAG